MEIARAEGGEAVFDLQSGGELTITALYVIHDAKRDGDVEREGARLAANVGSCYQGGAREAWRDGGFIVKRSPDTLLSRDGTHVLVGSGRAAWRRPLPCSASPGPSPPPPPGRRGPAAPCAW
jgi:hypothetical protein